MGVTKFRNKQAFRGPVTFAGSVGLNGPLVVNTPMVFKGTSGSSTAFFGVARINSQAATVVVSTTVVKSNDWIGITPIFRGGLQNSLAPLVVSTIFEGGFFTIAWGNGGNVAGTVVDACWEIRRVGS